MSDPRSLSAFIADVTAQIFTHTAPDGTFRAWDVSEAWRIASTRHELLVFPLEPHGVTPERVHELYQGIDEVYAAMVDLTGPLLFIPLGAECLLIDGWHRLFRAATDGVEYLPMYLLTTEEATAVQIVGPQP